MRRTMLKRMVAEKWVRAAGVIGFWPANSVGDDIELYHRRQRATTHLATLFTLRQQIARDPSRDRAHTALADFVAPKETGLADYVGGFAVTAGIGEEEAIAQAHRGQRRLQPHHRQGAVRPPCRSLRGAPARSACAREFWGYAAGEALSNDDLICGEVSRHPPGARLSGAARPHREGDAVRSCSDVDKAAGIELTESYAMWPGAAVSGLYFAHPESHYFGVGKIERDQVEDYAARKGWTYRGDGALAGADAQLRCARPARGGRLNSLEGEETAKARRALRALLIQILSREGTRDGHSIAPALVSKRRRIRSQQ